MIDSGFILMRQNSMANSKAKAEKANRENNNQYHPYTPLYEPHRAPQGHCTNITVYRNPHTIIHHA